MNNLEEFIKNNKKAFEENGPSTGLWLNIEAKLPKKQKATVTLKIYKWLSVAAVLVIGFGLYFSYNFAKQDVRVADINPEFAKKQVRFVTQIEELKDSLAIYAKQNPDLYQKFTADLKSLDADYEKLKAELPKSPNQFFVVKAIVKNREMQLQILNQQLEIINQVNNYKKEHSL